MVPFAIFVMESILSCKIRGFTLETTGLFCEDADAYWP